MGPLKTQNKIIESTIIEMLLERGVGKSICPSEVVRRLYPENWREKMDAVRSVAKELVEKKLIEITQKGKAVQADAKGPIRLRLREF